MSDRAPYSRVYWSIIDDTRFATVYDDDAALSAWLRLLLIADQAWPASAHLPVGVKAPALSKLVDSGLIVVTGSRYRVHGLDAERTKRSRSTPQQVPNNPPTTPQQVGSSEVVASSRARAPRLVSSMGSSSSTGGGPGEGLPHLDSAVAKTWEDATGLTVIRSGAKVAEYLDEACRRHPAYEVAAAILRARKLFDHIPDGMALVSGMRPILDPFVDSKKAGELERERERQAASRRGTEATLRRNHEVGGHYDAPHALCPACKEAEVTA